MKVIPGHLCALATLRAIDIHVPPTANSWSGNMVKKKRKNKIWLPIRVGRLFILEREQSSSRPLYFSVRFIRCFLLGSLYICKDRCRCRNEEGNRDILLRLLVLDTIYNNSSKLHAVQWESAPYYNSSSFVAVAADTAYHIRVS